MTETPRYSTGFLARGVPLSSRRNGQREVVCNGKQGMAVTGEVNLSKRKCPLALTLKDLKNSEPVWPSGKALGW